MTLTETVRHYYYTVALEELRLMSQGTPQGDLSYNSSLYLDLISVTENCTATKLAALLGISKPAVTSKITEMLGATLVVKRQSETDRRVFYIELSPAAQEIYRNYDRATERAEAAVRKKYSAEEIQTFSRVLKDLTASYYAEETTG